MYLPIKYWPLLSPQQCMGRLWAVVYITISGVSSRSGLRQGVISATKDLLEVVVAARNPVTN